jgi:hypothetical protein
MEHRDTEGTEKKEEKQRGPRISRSGVGGSGEHHRTVARLSLPPAMVSRVCRSVILGTHGLNFGNLEMSATGAALARGFVRKL